MDSSLPHPAVYALLSAEEYTISVSAAKETPQTLRLTCVQISSQQIAGAEAQPEGCSCRPHWLLLQHCAENTLGMHAQRNQTVP